MGMYVWIGRIHKTHIQKGKKTFLMIPIIGTNSVRHLMNVKDFICLTGTNELSRMLKTLLWSGLSLIRSMSLKVTDRCTLSAFLNLCMNNYWRELNKTHKDALPLPHLMKLWSQLNTSWWKQNNKETTPTNQQSKAIISIYFFQSKHEGNHKDNMLLPFFK